jgi:hypothetical protein
LRRGARRGNYDLVRASAGTDRDGLPAGALTFNPAASTAADAIDPDFAADVVWFDARHEPDRSPQNPEPAKGGRPWLIDHGAALYIHSPRDPDEHAR